MSSSPTLPQKLVTGAKTHFDQLWGYIVGPIAGGVIGASLYEFVGHHLTATVPGAAIPEGAHAGA